MAKKTAHSKIITEVAREALSPLGFFQKGRSRIWLDDRGWWLVVVEFQPSSWSRGTYLNLAAMWLWNEKKYFSFDVGGRLAEFTRYVDDPQFKAEVAKLADAARSEATRLRRQFRSIREAASYLEQKAATSRNPWILLAAIVALGYVGQVEKARAICKRVERQEITHPWEADLHVRAREFNEILENGDGFRRTVKETIHRARRLLKLPERSDLGL